jgi:hypothetical protein
MHGFHPHVIIHNKATGYQSIISPIFSPGPVTYGDHFFLYQMPFKIINELEMESGDEIEVSIEVLARAKVKQCGIHLLDEPNVMEEYVTKLFLFSILILNV